MSNLELIDLELDGRAALLEIIDLELEAAPPPATGNVLRILDLSLRATGGAPGLIGLPVLPHDPVQGGAQVTMGVVIDGEYDAVHWTVQEASLPVELAGTDTERQFSAPYDARGGDVLIAVVATNGGNDSDPVLLSVGVTPHTDWHLSGGQWRPTTTIDTLGD